MLVVMGVVVEEEVVVEMMVMGFMVLTEMGGE